MRKLALILFLFGLVSNGFAQPSRAGGPSQEKLAKLTDRQIFQALDRRDLTQLKALSLSRLWSVLQKGRPQTLQKTGFHTTIKFADGFGRQTMILLKVPKNPKGVLFVLHGLGGDRFQLGLGSFDKFAARNDLILVAPEAQKEPKEARNEDLGMIGGVLQHWWSYRPQGFVMKFLKDLRRTYNIDPNRVYLTGHSMGAFATFNIGIRYPDRFAALVPISGGISRREYLSKKPDRYLRSLLYNASNTNLLFVHGTSDKVVPVIHSRRTRNELKKLGYDFDYVELAGHRHMLDLRETGALMPGIVGWMAKQRRNPHPKRVRHRAMGKYMLESFWVRLDKVRMPNAQVDARILPGNRISLSTKKVDKMTIYIDEKLLNVKRPITIEANGSQVFSGKVQLSGVTLVESWWEREDQDLIYRGKVEIDLTKTKAKKR